MSEPNKCSLCGGIVGDDLKKHILSMTHQAALRNMLDSPLTEPDPRRNRGYKDQKERRQTGSLGDKNGSTTS